MSGKSMVIGLVRELEGRMRELLAEAASRGEYGDLPLLTGVASSLGELSRSMENGSLQVRSRGKGSSPPGTARSPTGKKHAKRRSRKSRKKAGYPKYFRQSDNLVKIGYSRKRGEYTHRAPRKAVMVVVDAVARSGAGGRLFATDEFMPVTDPTGEVDVLSYQSYIVLATGGRRGR